MLITMKEEFSQNTATIEGTLKQSDKKIHSKTKIYVKTKGRKQKPNINMGLESIVTLKEVC